MNSSFYNGVSGTKTHQFGMDVWADNISNVNNDGFKSSRPEFASVFATTLTNAYYGAAMSDKSYGSRAQTTALDVSQGILRSTDNPFDLALGSEGWFGVKNQEAQTYYTRTGSFDFDATGTLVDQNGFKLLGTLGNNLQPIQLEEEKMLNYGHIYGIDERKLVDMHAISKIDSIPLAAPAEQTEITLPESLYMPAIPTQDISIKANLDAKPKVEVTDIPLNKDDYQSIIKLEISEEDEDEDENEDKEIETIEEATNNEEEAEEEAFTPTATLNNDGSLSMEGTIANTPGIFDPKKDNSILLTITDANGKSIQRGAKLNEDLLTWNLNNVRIDELDTTKDLAITAAFRTEQEVPNEERFTSQVISPNGDKDLLDLRFTQRLPNTGDTTTWDSKATILKYHEPYEIRQYDSSKIYDEELYTINNNQVIKNYDPDEFFIDTHAKKVYKIIDTKEGEVTFAGSGAMLSHTMPLLDNSGFPLELDIGRPLETAPITEFEETLKANVLTLEGDGLKQGDSIQITLNDGQGHATTQSLTVGKDGAWSFDHDVEAFDIENTSIEVTHIIQSGWDGIVSNTALDKATIVKDENGVPEGNLVDYSMDSQGQIVAQFTNSQSIPVAKIAVYHFQNDQGLSSLNGNHFQSTVNSGEAIFYTDENGNFFQNTPIMSNRLEGSNVNLATALTELIVIQKAFSGNAKSITTSDEMIQNAIQMKR